MEYTKDVYVSDVADALRLCRVYFGLYGFRVGTSKSNAFEGVNSSQDVFGGIPFVSRVDVRPTGEHKLLFSAELGNLRRRISFAVVAVIGMPALLAVLLLPISPSYAFKLCLSLAPCGVLLVVAYFWARCHAGRRLDTFLKNLSRWVEKERPPVIFGDTAEGSTSPRPPSKGEVSGPYMVK